MPSSAPEGGLIINIDRMRNRSWPVLLVGFGMLIVLIGISGLGALRRARQTYREVSGLNDRYRRTERILNAVGSEIAEVGLLTRDYLLDPSKLSAGSYRSELVAMRARMESELQELSTVIASDEAPRLARLRKEVGAYWDVLDPLFEWTPAQKSALSWIFLRKQVLPRREAALAIAGEIRDLAQANLRKQRQAVDKEEADLPIFIGRMLGITVLIGLLVAGISAYRMTRLEQHSDEQRLRAESAEEELRLLSRQLVRAQEEERRSISRELHDEIGQMLTALRMELRNLQELRSAPEEQFQEHVEDARRLAEQTLRAVRDMAMGLRPSMLDDLGLGSAVQWQARQFSKHSGVPVNVQIEGPLAHLPDRHRTCVYRLVQEALTNCARHARAKTIGVSIRSLGDRLVVEVQDDGVGFDGSSARGRGLGLLGMQERVRELGGRFKVKSRPGSGTSVIAAIPLEREAVSA
jgi:signal transduction histidine kinase